MKKEKDQFQVYMSCPKHLDTAQIHKLMALASILWLVCMDIRIPGK